ncbi:MAG: hypothetical protein MUP08_09615 [Desulfobulbaceae bacterium]|nr:hypothetical protein [Desulfobulbaceae bacterium]
MKSLIRGAAIKMHLHEHMPPAEPPPAWKPYGLEAERLYNHCHSLKAIIRL